MTRRARHRGVPGEPVDPVPIGEALAEVGEELGLAEPRVIGLLSARWPEIVGPAVAEHARLRALRGSTLTVAVDSGPWATQLRYLEADVLARVAALVGDGVVDSVRVVVAPPGESDATGERGR